MALKTSSFPQGASVSGSNGVSITFRENNAIVAGTHNHSIIASQENVLDYTDDGNLVLVEGGGDVNVIASGNNAIISITYNEAA